MVDNNRRKILKYGALTTGAALVPGAASAKPSDKDTESADGESFNPQEFPRTDTLELKNGRLEYDTDQENLTLDKQQQLRLPELGDKEKIIPNSDIDWEKATKLLNKEKRQGRIEFSEQDGVPYINLTEMGRRIAEKARKEAGGSDEVVPLDHGKNDFKKKIFAVPPRVMAWTDDPTTRGVVIGAYSVSGLLGVWGVTGNIPAGVAGVILATSASIISTQNLGHGVKYTLYSLPPYPATVPTVTPQ